jgi:hypothetical protein
MDSRSFVRELEAFKAERLRPISEAGRIALAGEGPMVGGDKLLEVALANEISVSDLAARWMPNTREVDVKIAFARQSGDEAGHFQLVAERLAKLGFDFDNYQPPPANPLFEYLRTLDLTVERIAAGLFTLEAIAYDVNESFIAYCQKQGDRETVRIYRDIIQPEERAHEALGRELLAKYAVDGTLQLRAKEVVAKVLEIASSSRAKAAEKLGTACFPGC